MKPQVETVAPPFGESSLVAWVHQAGSPEPSPLEGDGPTMLRVWS